MPDASFNIYIDDHAKTNIPDATCEEYTLVAPIAQALANHAQKKVWVYPNLERYALIGDMIFHPAMKIDTEEAVRSYIADNPEGED